MNLLYKSEEIINDLLLKKNNEYIYISFFQRKHSLSYSNALVLLRICCEMKYLKEVFVFFHDGRWIVDYYQITDFPNQIYDEDTGRDLIINKDELFVCFEVTKNGF